MDKVTGCGGQVQEWEEDRPLQKGKQGRNRCGHETHNQIFNRKAGKKDRAGISRVQLRTVKAKAGRDQIRHFKQQREGRCGALAQGTLKLKSVTTSGKCATLPLHDSSETW